MSLNPALIHSRVVENIIQFVSEFYEVHSEGCKGRTLSIRYARRLQGIGGFQETMIELVKSGVLHATMKKSGGYLYYPQHVDMSRFANKVS